MLLSRFSELDFDLRGRIEISLKGKFAYVDTGEAKVQLDYSKVGFLRVWVPRAVRYPLVYDLQIQLNDAFSLEHSDHLPLPWNLKSRPFPSWPCDWVSAGWP